MERIRRLDRYQKGVMILITAMALVFTVIYPMTIAQEGFAYKNAILVPNQGKGSMVYSGKIQGEQASFTVFVDKTVEFQYGDKTYGPYTAKKDPTAVPHGSDIEEPMTGIELRKGDEILFRGGVLKRGEYLWLYNDAGSIIDFEGIDFESDVIVTDENGNVIDPMEPSISTILDLMDTPVLTHKGEWLAWFVGIFICAITAISILFADELFRWNLFFMIRDVDQAEPSEWKIAERYIGWTILPIMAMISFIIGLQ